MNKKTACILAVAMTLTISNAWAVPVTIQGVATNLQGRLHDNFDIVVEVVNSNGRVIGIDDVDSTGFFSIEVDPNDVPNGNVRLTVRASGTADIGGEEDVPIATNPEMTGLAGEVDASLAAHLTVVDGRVIYNIALTVPQALDCGFKQCCPKRGCTKSRCRSRRRCRR